MKLEVIPKRGILNILGKSTALALYPYIFLPEDRYQEYLLENPPANTQALLAHEQTHIERQLEKNPFIWYFLYLFWSNFRLQEELVAIKAEMKKLKELGVEMDIDRKAHFLSSWLYLKCITQEKAKQILEEMWADT